MAALFSSSHPPGESTGLHFRPARAALPHIRVETLIGSQANYEITIKISIYFYKIMISYEKNSTLNTKVSKFKFTVIYKIRITAGLTSMREVAALSSPTRIAYKLKKDTFLSNNAVL